MTTLDTTPSSPPVGLGSGAPAGAREGKLSTLPVTPWTPGSSLEAAPGDERGAGASSQPVEGPVTSEGTAPPALVITVHGTPAPQGSKRHVGHGVMIESSKKVKPWRQDVVAATLDAIDMAVLGGKVDGHWAPLDGCLHVRMVFTFTRPKSHYRTGRNAHLLHDDAPPQPQGVPDLDKLARSTCDALVTAGAIKDDARIVEYLRLAKVWTGEDVESVAGTGARIEIRQVRR